MTYEIWDDGNRLGEYVSLERVGAAIETLMQDDPERTPIVMWVSDDGTEMEVSSEGARRAWREEIRNVGRMVVAEDAEALGLLAAHDRGEEPRE